MALATISCSPVAAGQALQRCKAFDVLRGLGRLVYVNTVVRLALLLIRGHAVWSGDTSSDWATFALQIPTGLGAGISGIGLWTHDIGERLN